MNTSSPVVNTWSPIAANRLLLCEVDPSCPTLIVTRRPGRTGARKYRRAFYSLKQVPVTFLAIRSDAGRIDFRIKADAGVLTPLVVNIIYVKIVLHGVSSRPAISNLRNRKKVERAASVYRRVGMAAREVVGADVGL